MIYNLPFFPSLYNKKNINLNRYGYYNYNLNNSYNSSNNYKPSTNYKLDNTYKLNNNYNFSNNYNSKNSYNKNNIFFPNFHNTNHYSSNSQKKINEVNQKTIQEKNKDIKEEVEKVPEIFEIFGLKLYFDDILLICLIFFLYNEGVKDQYLFISLILLLLS